MGVGNCGNLKSTRILTADHSGVAFQESQKATGLPPTLRRKSKTMRITMKSVSLALPAILLAVHPAGLPAQSQSIAELKRSFDHPPDNARIMMRWWWFGPAVTTGELEREMRLMKDGGIGGFEVQAVYPLTLDDPARGLRNLTYVSPEFLDALRFTGEKARELKLRMDLTLGSGWPYGGPHIPVSKASGRLRVERVPISENSKDVPSPHMEDGDTLVARMDTGVDSPRLALFFIASHTRQTVKRAAVGAEGFVLDHYDRTSLETHLKSVGEPMLKALAKTPPHAIFSDSLEVYNSDWTPNFLAEFSKRRGYDLKPHLLALTGETAESSAIRHDWGRTLTELLDREYLTPLADFAHQHKTLLRSQTYGIPPASLSSNALVDLPEGEGSDWRQFSTTRWASSASHLYGRPVTSSETWTWLHSPAFRATPLDMKAEADRHFLEGINQLIGHGWPYSPAAAGNPGWAFYAAAVFSEHNPWWIVMPDITAYLQRVSFILRQGRPENDVAIYLPTDDAWANFTLGNVSINQQMTKLLNPSLVPQVLDAGYNFDFIDDEAIARAGITHAVLILPNVERMPIDTYRKISEYARKGGIVLAVGRTPSLAPGFANAAAETARVREMSRALFEAEGARGKRVPEVSQLAALLHSATAPDVERPTEVGFVHRKLDFADIYFLVNTSNHAVRGAAVFRITGRAAQWWDPFTGKTSAAGDQRVDLDLAPYESRVLVFSNERLESQRAASGAAPAPVDVSSGWSVTFPESSQPAAMAQLHSWTADSDHSFFSGVATYENTIQIAPAMLNGGREVYLNFGEGTPVTTEERRSGNGMRAMLEGPVREAAVVYVNGKVAGSVWHPPYEIPVGKLLKAGPNTVRVMVANLAINQLAKVPPPDFKDLIARYGDRFQNQDMKNLQPLPSGLLGPIRLIPR
jgi:hypothetical protein